MAPRRTARNDAQSQWPVADAKARFSEVIAKALAEGPQVITRNGKRAAVLVSPEDWDRRRGGTLVEFFQSAPDGFADLDLERLSDGPRKVEL